jgi:hypothetical protein
MLTIFMLSNTLLEIRIKYCINCFMSYLLPTIKKIDKLIEFVSEFIPNFILSFDKI